LKTYFKTQVFPTPYDAAERLAMDIIRFVENMLIFRENLYIALSGGNSFTLMYEIIAREFSKSLNWEKLHFFWVDERCVPLSSNENNFGNAYSTLFSNIDIPDQNLHHIHGGDDPVSEVIRYTGEILSFVPCFNNYPCFDLILLGLGDDGHTASIFPGHQGLFETTAICALTQHPVTKQKRITLTGKSINNAMSIAFLVYGNNKANILKSIFSDDPSTYSYPAKNINLKNGTLAWYLDNEAATYIM
jgi:6-phosphogluconolactonase